MEAKTNLERLIDQNMSNLLDMAYDDEAYDKVYRQTMQLYLQKENEAKRKDEKIDRIVRTATEIAKVGVGALTTLTVAKWVMEQEQTGCVSKNLFALIPKIKL